MRPQSCGAFRREGNAVTLPCRDVSRTASAGRSVKEVGLSLWAQVSTPRMFSGIVRGKRETSLAESRRASGAGGRHQLCRSFGPAVHRPARRRRAGEWHTPRMLRAGRSTSRSHVHASAQPRLRCIPRIHHDAEPQTHIVLSDSHPVWVRDSLDNTCAVGKTAGRNARRVSP